MQKAVHPTASSVYSTFWKFAAERQRVFLRRLRNSHPPHTSDPILQKFRFTNAYRAADRVSQYLIARVLYQGNSSPPEVVFRSLLFRTFNRIETWSYLADVFGEIAFKRFSAGLYADALDRLYARGETVYSSAYIMPSRGRNFSEARKHRNHLNLIEYMMRDGLPSKLERARSLKDVYELFLSYPMFGPFLAFQFSIDVKYSAVVDFSEMDFVIAGPGARSGIRKCFNPDGTNDADVIRYVTDQQEIDSKACGENFETLWGRPLQLIDVQNLFCEVDKYTRVSHPSVAGIGDRTRIKRSYASSGQPITYWFPPKWGLNDRVAATRRAESQVA